MTLINNILLILIIIIVYDFSNINNLWGERFERRLIHHLSGNNYNINKIPIIYPVKNILSVKQCNYICKLNLPIRYYNINQNIMNTFGQILGTQNSQIKPMYYDDFSLSVQKELDIIGTSLIPRFNQITGEKLSLSQKNFRSCILIYKGNETNFCYHYDTEPSSYYRAIILIYKKGNIPKFSYITQNSSIKTLNFEIGDGIIFKGSQTYHGVLKSIDKNSIRYVLGFQYQNEQKEVEKKSLCSELRGKPPIYILKICYNNFLIFLLLILIFSYLLPKNININIQKLLIYFLGIIIFLTSLSYFKINNLGSKYPISIKTSLILFVLIFILLLFRGYQKSLIISIIVILYLIITEILMFTNIYKRVYLSKIS